MDTLTYSMALVMGFTGSLHCAGMCGPIVWVMPFQQFAGPRKMLALALYHLGRISVYAALALVLFSFRGLFRPAVQQYISPELSLHCSIPAHCTIEVFPQLQMESAA